MGFFKHVIVPMIVESVVEDAFNRGLKGQAPPVRATKMYQDIADEAYEKGRQTSLARRAGGDVLSKAEDILKTK